MRGLIVSSVGGLVSAVLVFVVVAWLAPREWKGPPRDRSWSARSWRRLPWWQKLGLVIWPIGAAGVIVPQVLDGKPGFLALVVISVLPALWLAFFGDELYRGTDAALNYRFEPDRCGACSYDLRVGGPGGKATRCPECEWPVPATVPQIEPPDWWVLSRHGGRVEYLYDAAFTAAQNWRAALLMVSLSAAVGSLAFLPGDGGAFVNSAFVGLGFAARSLVNARRATAYARRHGGPALQSGGGAV